MYRSGHTIWILAGGVTLLIWAGCAQTTRQVGPPGALPGSPWSDQAAQLNATTLFSHAHLLERQGLFERAVVQYEKALRLNPGFLTARNRLGITLNKLGRHALASDQFRTAIAQNPNAAYFRNNLGFSLYLEGKYEEAEAALEGALKLDSSFSRARMNRGIVLAKLGRFDEALTDLLAVGTQADAYFNMGMLLTEGERFADAAEYLQAALDAKPDFEAARRQLHDVSRLAAEYDARQEARLAAAEHMRRLAETATNTAVVSEELVIAADTVVVAESEPVAGVEAREQVAAQEEQAPSEADPAPALEPTPEPVASVKAEEPIAVETEQAAYEADPAPAPEPTPEPVASADADEPVAVEIKQAAHEADPAPVPAPAASTEPKEPVAVETEQATYEADPAPAPEPAADPIASMEAYEPAAVETEQVSHTVVADSAIVAQTPAQPPVEEADSSDTPAVTGGDEEIAAPSALLPVADVTTVAPAADSVAQRQVAATETVASSGDPADTMVEVEPQEVLDAPGGAAPAELTADLEPADAALCRLEQLLFPEEEPGPITPPAESDEDGDEEADSRIDLISWLPESLLKLFR